MERRANGKFTKTPSKHHLNKGMAKAEKMGSKIGTKMGKEKVMKVIRIATGTETAKVEMESKLGTKAAIRKGEAMMRDRSPESREKSRLVKSASIQP